MFELVLKFLKIKDDASQVKSIWFQKLHYECPCFDVTNIQIYISQIFPVRFFPCVFFLFYLFVMSAFIHIRFHLVCNFFTFPLFFFSIFVSLMYIEYPEILGYWFPCTLLFKDTCITSWINEQRPPICIVHPDLIYESPRGLHYSTRINKRICIYSESMCMNILNIWIFMFSKKIFYYFVLHFIYLL